MLLWEQLGPESIKEFQRDIWDRGEFEKDKDKVGKKLREFVDGIEGLGRPIVDREFGKEPRPGTLKEITDWLGM
jgi:hypothetical protein